MAPIAKENEVLTATTTESALRPSATKTPPSEATGRPQPVALEVSVSVNGARTVVGSDKREPFSESTKTVLVFGNGAVIRLQSPVAPGQLLFLTNDKTKKEVVCQVVKSKNYRNVSGYVELEFTEAVVGFWGMRFPNDRIGAPVAPSPVSQPMALSAPPKPAVPAAPKSDAAANFNALKALSSSTANADLPRTPDVSVAPPAVKTQPPTEIAAVNPVAAVPPPTAREAAPGVNDPSTEALKQQAVRLQEQLASMLFAERTGASATTATPPSETKDMQNAAAKIIEFVKPATPQATTTPVVHEAPKNVVVAPPKPVQPIANVPAKSVLDAEEVKIPSWLEPLARNAAHPSAPEETSIKEEPRHREEPILESYIAPEPEASSAANDIQAATPIFETSLLGSEQTNTGTSRSSNKGLLIGAIAAGLVLAAAGGAWFMRNQSGSAQASTPGASVTSAAVIQTPAQASNATLSGPASNSTANSGAIVAAPLSPAGYPAAGSANSGVNGNGGISGNAAVGNAVVKTPQPAAVPAAPPVQAKKPALGEVRLAAPVLNRGGHAPSANEAEPGISLGNSEPAPNDALGGGLANRSRGPAAPAEPLAVGGDVRPAKLLNSVSPIYPSLAKSQHVSGDVRVDALIDANGKVTTMKVVSGPTLLHQAAMDALRQWKYQPATLDGKTVPMHLTVTLQFRLQ